MKITKTASGKTKIVLTKSEWKTIGKKAGWEDKFDHTDPSNYAPGQTPYKDEEWNQVQELLQGALDEQDGRTPDDKVNRRRSIIVTMNDGTKIHTDINGTKDEIEEYYVNQEFVKDDETTMMRGIHVEFVA